jgi:hypothetical protein
LGQGALGWSRVLPSPPTNAAKRNIRHKYCAKEANMKVASWRLALSLPVFACCVFVTGLHGQLTVPPFKAGGAKPPQSFGFRNISPNGTKQVQAYGINDNGIIVGSYVDSGGREHGMLLNGSELTSVDCPSAGPTAVYSLNANGYGVASCGPDGSQPGGFWVLICGPSGCSWVFVPLPQPVCPDCPVFGLGINDLQQVVGTYFNQENVEYGFVYNLETRLLTTLKVPGATGTLAWGINDSDQLTLQASDASGVVSSYLYYNGDFTSLNVPGAFETYAQGISNSGDIAMIAVSSNNEAYGVLRHSGGDYEFSDPNSNGATYPYGINSKQTIVGLYQRSESSSQIYSFEATY